MKDARYYLEQSGIKLPGHKKRAAKKAAKQAKKKLSQAQHKKKQIAISNAIARKMGLKLARKTTVDSHGWMAYFQTGAVPSDFGYSFKSRKFFYNFFDPSYMIFRENSEPIYEGEAANLEGLQKEIKIGYKKCKDKLDSDLDYVREGIKIHKDRMKKLKGKNDGDSQYNLSESKRRTSELKSQLKKLEDAFKELDKTFKDLK